MESMRFLVKQMEQEETSVGELRRESLPKKHSDHGRLHLRGKRNCGVGNHLVGALYHPRDRRRERDAAALRQSEEWFRVTLSSIGDGVIATDDQGRVSFLNPVAERLTGTSLAQARGKKIGEVFPILSEATNKPVENPVEKVLALGSVWVSPTIPYCGIATVIFCRLKIALRPSPMTPAS